MNLTIDPAVILCPIREFCVPPRTIDSFNEFTPSHPSDINSDFYNPKSSRRQSIMYCHRGDDTHSVFIPSLLFGKYIMEMQHLVNIVSIDGNWIRNIYNHNSERVPLQLTGWWQGNVTEEQAESFAQGVFCFRLPKWAQGSEILWWAL